MAAKKFITNTLLLTLTATALRVVGMAYRIFISNKIGETGMGLYQLILSVYMLCNIFATAGLSVAVTRLVSEQCVAGNPKGIQNIMRFAIRWSLSVSLMIAALLFFSAGGIADHLIKEPAAAASLRVLSAGLPFMAMSACFSGYFLARSRAGDICLSQVLEQVVRIGVVVTILDAFKGTANQCMGVFIGNAVSEAAAFTVYFILYKIDVRLRAPTVSLTPQPSNIFSRFMPIALPIAGAKYLTGSLHSAENLLVPVQIEKFTADKQLSLSQFGALKGMALPVLMFPSSFLTTIATLLIPEITAAYTLRQQDKIAALTQKALRITFTLSILMSGLFFTFAYPIGQILYKSETVGGMIRVLAPVVPFMYLDCIADGLLKGLGEQMATLRYNTLDSSLRILLTLFLVPRKGMSGFLIVMLLSNTLVSCLELYRLTTVSRTALPLKSIGLCLLSIIVCHLCLGRFVTADTRLPKLMVLGLVYAGLYLLINGKAIRRDLKMRVQPR